MAPRLQRRPHSARQPDRRGRESPSPPRSPTPLSHHTTTSPRRSASQGFPVHGPRLHTGIRRTRHGPRIRMAASTSGGAEPLEARRWRPLRELGKVCFNERCAARSKGAFGPVAIRGPFPQAGQRTTRRGVGKHPAPSGALRPRGTELILFLWALREAPSTIRCIETRPVHNSRLSVEVSREAPSTTRCIETPQERCSGQAS